MVMMCTGDNIDFVHNKRLKRMRTDLFDVTLNQMEVALCVRTAFAISWSNDNKRLYKTAAWEMVARLFGFWLDIPLLPLLITLWPW